MKNVIKSLALSTALLGGASVASADTIKMLCYENGSECQVTMELAKEFASKTGHTVEIETVAYEIIRDQLENQLQSGASPDVARVTNLGGLNPYYLDLAPYVDGKAWENDYSATLAWFRAPGDSDNGIYGWVDGLTVTGPYVNVTMFDDAGVDMPVEGATWDDWMAALTEVKSALGMDAVFAMDRTAHRWAGPAFSYGAKFFDGSGNPILVDAGFRDYAEKFVGWHKDGLMPMDGWPAGSGTQYRNAAALFTGQKVVMHMSGSWMIGNYADNIKDFEWKAVAAPCGAGGCGAMPGGSAFVAFKDTKSPEAAAAWIDWLSKPKQSTRFAAATSSITANQSLQKTGVDYGSVSPSVSEALSVFAGNAGRAASSTPQAYTFQGYNKNFVIYGVVPDYITRAINGEISLNEALAAIDADVAAKIAE